MLNFKKCYLFLAFFIVSTIFGEMDLDQDLNFYKISNDSKIKIFSGSSNKKLAADIAKDLGVDLGKVDIGLFNDGEIKISIRENIRGCDVYIIQSTCPSENRTINDNVMELLLFARACKKSGAKTLTAVIPYFGYGRQDRSFFQEPISASDVAMFLEKAGVDHVISIDLHCGQIEGFFKQVSSDNISPSPVFCNYMLSKKLQNPVIVSPDAGGVARAKKFREKLAHSGIEANMAIIIKERFEAGVVENMTLVGDVAGCDAIIIDDIIDTAGTLVRAAEELKKHGAVNVYACITHPVFSPPAIERIKASQIDELIVSDTITINKQLPENISQISISTILARVIYKRHMESCFHIY